jgi:hypothetical protein
MSDSFQIKGFSYHTAHVSDLKMAVLEEDEREALFNEPTSLGEREFVVQRLHAHRQVSRNRRDYLVEWGGFRDKRTYTWEPRVQLETTAKDILHRYDVLFRLSNYESDQSDQSAN